MSELTPAQLDALEDALEQLDVLPSGHAGDPTVAQRLDDYREILQWTRDAMPLQEVRPGLLDGVLEEARSVAPVSVSASEPAAPVTSWWKKLRGVFLVPALAVAGSAALVLLLVQPGAKEDAPDTALARADERANAAAKPAEDAPLPEQLSQSEPAGALHDGIADASVDRELSRGRLRLEEESAADRGAAAIEGEADARSQAAPQAPPAAEPPPPPPEPAAAPSKTKEKPSDKVYYDDNANAQKARKSGSAGGVPGGAAAPAEQAGPPKPVAPARDVEESEKKEDGADADDDRAGAWSTIATADQARRAGDCIAARSKYKSLANAKDHRVRARALAGLGLCESNEKAADGWFDKARKADPDIAGFIAHERGSAPMQAAPPDSSL